VGRHRPRPPLETVAPGSTAVQDSYPSGAGERTARVGNDDPTAGHNFTVYALCTP
jgi:hypothetical protein